MSRSREIEGEVVAVVVYAMTGGGGGGQRRCLPWGERARVAQPLLIVSAPCDGHRCLCASAPGGNIGGGIPLELLALVRDSV